ncbi:MAG TPA: rod shape-determining protein RodA [Candidatus Sulfotelmatobacter sp.]|nr:rod shape-determining protein RodA [Candidatus Sulfotelmatobacter sp.]
MSESLFGRRDVQLTVGQKLWDLNWGLVLLITATSSIGFLMLYSVASGHLEPWAAKQMMRFAIGIAIMFAVALVDIRVWLKYAYHLYAVALVLLVVVDVAGHIGMGAKRWIDLGPLNLQPSEIMKIAIVLALARYFHGLSIEDVGKIRWLIVPIIMVLAPAGLVLKQPDLGTALLLLLGSAIMFLLAGVRIWMFAVAIAGALGVLPVAWKFLRDYQKERLLTFLNPENDPLGSGYHILQSKIALGSGGLFGKGFMLGTQSHLNFLPEKQTDFIFTTLAEEFGMVGGLVLLGLYVLIFAYGFGIGLRSRNQFGRLVGLGMTGMFFLYVFINIAMVTGLVPVVGVPLPLVSYGGTAMLTLLFGFGLLMSVYIHRDVQIPRRPETAGL